MNRLCNGVAARIMLFIFIIDYLLLIRFIWPNSGLERWSPICSFRFFSCVLLILFKSVYGIYVVS